MQSSSCARVAGVAETKDALIVKLQELDTLLAVARNAVFKWNLEQAELLIDQAEAKLMEVGREIRDIREHDGV